MAAQNDINRVIIGDGVNSVAAASATIPTVAAGDLFMLREDSSIVPTAAAAATIPKFEEVTIAFGTGKPTGTIIIQSSKIRGDTVERFTGAKFSPPVQQITYVGFDAVNGGGNLIVSDNSEFELRILFLDDRRVHGQRQTKALYNFTTGTAATLSEVQDGIARIEDDIQLRYPAGEVNQGVRLVTVERVSNGGFTVLGGASTLTVTQGSFTAIASGAHALVIGDSVRIGAVGTAGAATEPIYTVVNVVGTTITLDVHYKGISGVVANADVGEMDTQTLFGFRITGNAIPFYEFDEYETVRFTASFGDAGLNEGLVSESVPVNTTQSEFPGTGFAQQVFDLEKKARAYLGQNNEYAHPIVALPLYTDFTKSYNVINIKSSNITGGEFQDLRNHPTATDIFVPLITDPPGGGEQANATGDNFVAIINAYFSTVLGFDALDFT